MKKLFLLGALLSGGFLVNDNVFAAEQTGVAEREEKQIVEVYEESQNNKEPIVFDGSQDVLVTENFIITKVSDVPPGGISKYFKPLNNNIITPFAGDGVWNLLGYENVRTLSNIYSSTGGDFKIEIGQDSRKVRYHFVEDDVIFLNIIDEFTIEQPGIYTLIWRGLNGWLDGPDNKAEFRLHKLDDFANTVFAIFYD